MSTLIPGTTRHNALSDRPFDDVRALRIKEAEAKNTQVIVSSTNEINELAGQDRLTIPESLFVKYFLPMFAGEDEETFPPTAMQEWMRISKHGIAPVDIIDASGKVLVTMPARYSRKLVDVRTDRSRISLFDSMKTFSELAVSSPIRAQNYYHRVIAPRAGREEEMAVASNQYIADIKKVLEYFGKNTDFLNSTVNTSADKPSDEKTNPEPNKPDNDYIDDSDLL